jgi:hypothetical protein
MAAPTGGTILIAGWLALAIAALAARFSAASRYSLALFEQA